VDHPSQVGCPRVLAISPNGDEVACGDRVGNLRIWSINNNNNMDSAHKRNLYDMVFNAPAHDAEILCLDYTFQHEVNKSNSLKRVKSNDDGVVPLSSSSSSANGGDDEDDDNGSEGWVPVLLASGGRDRLIHVLGASEDREKIMPSSKVNNNNHSNNNNNNNNSGGGVRYTLLQTLEHHESAVTSLKFSQNGKKLFSIGAEGSLSLSKVNPLPLPSSSNDTNKGNNKPSSDSMVDSSESMLPSERIHRYRSVPLIHGVSYDIGSDVTGKYVVCAGQTDCKLHIYSAASGKHLRSYSADPNDPHEDENDFNANNNNLDDDENDGKKKKSSKKSVTSELYKIDLCPAGMYLATCSFDRWIRLIDFYSGQIIAQVYIWKKKNIHI
jgi:WD40 repeat protein